MPFCSQCQTSDTPCWREGPEGARTLCNACGIRWKRLIGKTKRSIKRTPQPVPKKSSETPIKKSRPVRVATRSVSHLKEEKDQASLGTKKILSMSKNELLESILTMLEELEYSQTRISLQVRVLTKRLINQKQLLNGNDNENQQEKSSDDEYQNGQISSDYDEDLEQDLELMMNGDGEDAAWLLASMQKGTPVTRVPYEEITGDLLSYA